ACPTTAGTGRLAYAAPWTDARPPQGPIPPAVPDRGLKYKSFYNVNAVLVTGSRDIAEALAARQDVARLEGNPHIQNWFPQPGPSIEWPSQRQAPETIEPGISYTHAPDVWALGFNGQNIVVGSADTGQGWSHNALKPNYRGWDGHT